MHIKCTVTQSIETACKHTAHSTTHGSEQDLLAILLPRSLQGVDHLLGYHADAAPLGLLLVRVVVYSKYSAKCWNGKYIFSISSTPLWALDPGMYRVTVPISKSASRAHSGPVEV